MTYLRLQTFGEKRITHGEVIRSSLLGDNVVCDVYLRITCNHIPDNAAAREHVRLWVKGVLNLPFQSEDGQSKREYKVEEVHVTEMNVVI